MSTDLVSVIIPMYNASATIGNALRSVVSQTYRNFEIIIINDGSKDNSVEIAESFIQQHTGTGLSFKLYHQANSGVSAARNAGLKIASGKYIALLDSDDEWHPEKTAKQMNILLNNREIDFIGCNRNNEKLGFPYKEVNGILQVKLTALLFKMAPQTSTAIFKKDILDEVGLYDERQKYAEDGNLWLRICTKRKMAILQESLVVTGGGKRSFGTSGLSARLWAMQQGEFKNIREMYGSKHINVLQFAFFFSYSFVKFIRRIFIVKVF